MNVEIKILNKEFYIRHKMSQSYYDTPSYETPGSAAMDLRCTEDVTLMPGERKMIPTGIAVWIGAYNTSVAGLVLPRSGLGTKGLVLANTIGLIDEDYQGELLISAWNNSENVFNLAAGDRIAQLMLVPIIKAQFKVVDVFSGGTDRLGGFSSTGVK